MYIYIYIYKCVNYILIVSSPGFFQLSLIALENKQFYRILRERILLNELKLLLKSFLESFLSFEC